MTEQDESPLQLRLSGKALDTVRRIRNQTAAPTSVDVVRKAIALYSALQPFTDESGTLYVQDPKSKQQVKVLMTA